MNNLISLSRRSSCMHVNDAVVAENNTCSIPVRISSHRWQKSRVYKARNLVNLINVNIDKPSCRAPHNKFATWNAHSLNTKSAHICDLVISQHLDILAITETWLSDENFQNNYCHRDTKHPKGF